MPTCFVVQGFGEKVDLSNGRTLNLDASYQVIKEAVESAGLTCVRADEVVSSGTIDIPMYDWILKADLVIADLSTYNVNAAYELGVRYGVGPRATIIVAEEQFKNPFDVSHIVLHRYKHLGEDVGVAESAIQGRARWLIRSVMASTKPTARSTSSSAGSAGATRRCRAVLGGRRKPCGIAGGRGRCGHRERQGVARQGP